ncbi:MAG: tyrosine-type recombinase/integrase, partial [Actinomycetota bacterium]|nr:tyrosine-type recombinase/integrase [Actinomycetota bacterium]
GGSPAQIPACATYARRLVWLPAPLGQALAGVDAAAVTGFVLEHSAASSSTWSAKAQVSALRALLRFVHIHGLIPAPLVAAVAGVAGWRLSELPRSLPAAQVTALLAAHDRSTPVGLRDHAVLLTLARLGLRGGELAALGLADVDWRVGQLVVHGKGAGTEALPLPVEVGQALADYVTGARPRCGCSALFVTARAPYQPLTPGAVRAIMGRACRRAGLPRTRRALAASHAGQRPAARRCAADRDRPDPAAPGRGLHRGLGQGRPRLAARAGPPLAW